MRIVFGALATQAHIDDIKGIVRGLAVEIAFSPDVPLVLQVTEGTLIYQGAKARMYIESYANLLRSNQREEFEFRSMNPLYLPTVTARRGRADDDSRLQKQMRNAVDEFGPGGGSTSWRAYEAGYEMASWAQSRDYEKPEFQYIEPLRRDFGEGRELLPHAARPDYLPPNARVGPKW